MMVAIYRRQAKLDKEKEKEKRMSLNECSVDQLSVPGVMRGSLEDRQGESSPMQVSLLLDTFDLLISWWLPVDLH